MGIHLIAAPLGYMYYGTQRLIPIRVKSVKTILFLVPILGRLIIPHVKLIS